MTQYIQVNEQEVNDIQNAYKTMYDGMIKKDAEILEEILDNSFVLIHMTGMRQSKPEFIRAILDGTLNYYTVEHKSADVNGLNSHHVRLDGKSIVNAAVFGGGRHIWRLRQRLKLIKADKGWKIIEAVASTY